MGRLAPWKGQHVFLEAAALLLRRAQVDPCTQFVIIGGALFGEDDYERRLCQQSAELGIASNVTFLGHQKDVAAVLDNLDILVHASITPEPFGQVILEGMAKGLPVVATDAGGIREIVTHRENGLLVPPGDAQALAGELHSLFSDAERRTTIGRAGYEHVCQNFRSSKTARAVEAVYGDVISVPRRDNRRNMRPSRRLSTGRFFRYFMIPFLLLTLLENI